MFHFYKTNYEMPMLRNDGFAISLLLPVRIEGGCGGNRKIKGANFGTSACCGNEAMGRISEKENEIKTPLLAAPTAFGVILNPVMKRKNSLLSLWHIELLFVEELQNPFRRNHALA